MYVCCGPPFTSPKAQMPSAVVRSRSSTFTAPRSVSSTPAASRFRPSTFGVRPVATNTASVDRHRRASEPTSDVPLIETDSLMPSSADVIALVSAPNRNLTPCDSSWARIAAATSSSSRGRNSSLCCSTVTAVPKSANIEANSSPMNPAPMITSRCGSSSTSIRPVLVYTPGVVRMPGMSGMCGVAPVLMNIMSAATATGPSAVVISALWVPVKRARPVITVMLPWSASLW